MDDITIRAFRAPEDPEMCVRYMEEHARVLTDLGVATVVKYDDSWMRDRDVIVFVAIHPTLGLVGGIRLQRSKPGLLMPMEKALEKIEPKIFNALTPLNERGNAELGALWNAHRFAGKGVPHLLIAAAVATATQADLTAMVCLVAQYIAPYCSATGFKNIPSVGNGGEFVYPIPSIRSYAMAIDDVQSLENANSYERQRAISLRVRPAQTRIEQPKKDQLRVTYDLQLDKSDRSYEEIVAFYARFAAA